MVLLFFKIWYGYCGDLMSNNIKMELKYLVKLLIVFFLFFFSSYLQFIPVILFRIKKVDGTVSVFLNSFSNIVLLIILIIIYRKDLVREWKTFKSNTWRNVDIGIKSWLVGLLGMMIFNIILNNLFKANGATNEQAVQKMITAFPWLMLVNGGITGPFIEEIVFRKAFKDVFKTKWLFIIFSGVVFGLMHVVSSFTSFSNFLYFIPYSCLGIAFCYAYYITDSIYTSAFLHIFHNTSLILLSILL